MSEWISVEERLPSCGVPVLGIVGLAVRGYLRDDESGDGWLWARHHIGPLNDPSSYEGDDDYPVTHWMPLPQPPSAS